MNRPTLVSISILLALISACTDSRRPASPDAAGDTAQTRPDTLDAGDPDANPPPSDTVSADDDAAALDTTGDVASDLVVEDTGADVAPDDGPPDVCDGVDCSGHGTCVELAGAATCSCEPGFTARDLGCVPDCAVWSTAQPMTFDIDVASLAVDITVNGAPLATDLTWANLRAPDDGRTIASLVYSDGVPYPAQPVLVPPGGYDLEIIVEDDLFSFGRRRLQILHAGRHILEGDTAIVVDVDTVEVEPRVTIGGAQPGQPVGLVFVGVDGTANAGSTIGLSLLDDDGTLGRDGERESFELLAGDWDVYYSYSGYGGDDGALLVNERAHLGRYTLTHDGPLLLDVAEVPTRLDVAVTVNATPMGGTLTLESADGDQAWFLLDRHGRPLNGPVPVLPKAYDVFFEPADVPGAPRNQKISLGAYTIGGETQLIELDVPTVSASFTLAVDGQPVADHARLHLQSADGVDTVVLPLTSDDNPVVIAPGEYDVRYEHVVDDAGGAGSSPRNLWYDLGRHLVTEGTTLGFDLARVDIAVVVTRRGLALDAASVETDEPVAFVVFVGASDDGVVVPIQGGGRSATTVPVLAGEYDVYYYAARGVPSTAPVNWWAPLGRRTLEADGELTFDLPTLDLDATITIGGHTPEAAGLTAVGLLVMGGVDGSNQAAWAFLPEDGKLTAPYTDLRPVIQGTYELEVELYSFGVGQSAVRGFDLGCWTLAP